MNMQNGLADNIITSINKDKNGFIWLGTRNGLSRYDGSKVTNFELIDPYLDIKDIKETSDKMLVFIANGRLSAFDLQMERYVPVVSAAGKKITVNRILPCNDSLLWAITGKELLLLKQQKEPEQVRMEVQARYAQWLDEQATWAALAYSSDRKTLCLVDHRSRIVLLDAQSMQPIRTVDLGIQTNMLINSVLYDNDRIWIATTAHGIIHYHVPTGKVTRLTYSISPSDRSLTHTDIFDIVRLNEDKYLAVTWNGYTLLHVNPEKPDEILTELYNNTSSFTYRNLESRMISVYYDASGILWIGTDGGGVIWSDLRMQFYNRFNQDRHNEICAIVTDNDGYLWLATFHRGLMKSDQPFNYSTKLTFAPVASGALQGKETVLCGLKDEHGDLWFGNQDGTLTHYHHPTHSFQVVTLTDEKGSSNQESVWSMHIDRHGRLWIGTSKDVWRLDRTTRHSQRLSFSNRASAANLFVRSMAETTDGTLWLGSATQGLCRVVNEHTLQSGYERAHGISGISVRSLLAASDGTLYVGYMTGFGVFSPTQNAFTHAYTTHDGLCNNFIGCLIEDGEGQIWLGSNSGISRYSKHRHLFYNYYVTGSNRSAFCDGNTLFWGNNRNLTYFHPEDIHAFTTPKAIAITGLEVNNKPVEIGKKENGQVILEKSIFYTSDIRLNYENHNFSLTFNNLSYSENQQKYSYRLRPYQREWLITNGEEKVSYANLPAGYYVFEVKNIQPDDQESQVTTLGVTVLPHWSETLLFRLFLCLLAALGAYFVVYRIRLKQKRLEDELQLKHEVFTATLERDKEKQIRMERENFFTNTAHELRTPLTLILSPLQELLHTLQPTDAMYPKLQTIYQNSASLHTLVDHLLYVQKIEAGMVELHLSETDIVELTQGVATSFRQLAEVNRVDFQVHLPQAPLFLWIDLKKITSALQNLLSNAFKYTPSGGCITLHLDRTEVDGMSFCRIVVADTGKGIPQELQGRIFDSFITGTNEPMLSTKVGIGLRIVRHTLDLHHGTVTLESTPGQGSKFILLLPMGNAHFTAEEYELSMPPTATALSAMADTPDEATGKPTPKRQRLLIVEDNDNVRQYIVSLFRPDYQVYEATNGEEGVRIATEQVPDLVISDIMMPVKDGFACCKELREQPQTAHIPLLMLTAKAEDTDVLHASKIGVDDYMMKPFNPEILKSKVRNLILQRERLKRIYTKTLMLKQQPETEEAGTPPTNQFIHQIIQVIEAHLADENFNVKMLAEQLNMSQPTLYRKIKQHSELNAIDMIRSVRMSKAASLLMENRYTMQQIAEMVGYSDTRTLRKHFTDQFGVSPSKYINKE